MALARLALRNMSNMVCSSASSTSYLVGHGVTHRSCNSVGVIERLKLGDDQLLKKFMTTASDKVASETSDGKEVAVSEGSCKKSKLFSRRKGNKGLWRGNRGHFVPSLHEFFPSGLGNALIQATENINKLFENLNISPSNLIGRVKEKDNYYKLRYEVPGLSKEDLKIIVDNGVLTITGEHKEEEEDSESDDDYWSVKSYGYIHTTVILPEDAKADEIKAELKDGLLFVVIPRTEKTKRDVNEVEIN